MKYSCWWPFLFSSLRACAIILLKRSYGICLLLNMALLLWKTKNKWVYRICFSIWFRYFEWILGKVVRTFPLLFPTPLAEDVVDFLLLELYCGRRCVSVYLVNKFASSSAMQMFYISLSNITPLAPSWMSLRDSHLELLDYPEGDSHLKLQDQSHKNQWSILSK